MQVRSRTGCFVLFALALSAGVFCGNANANNVSANANATQTLIGRVQIYHSHETGRIETLVLENSDLPVTVRNLQPEIASGDRVRVKGRPVSVSINSTHSTQRRHLMQLQGADETVLDIEDVELLEEAPGGKDFVVDGQPVELTSATVLIREICNTSLRYDVASVNSSWFGPAAGTLQQVFKKCSYGQLLWNPDKNIVVTMPSVPCTGSRTNENGIGTYSFDYSTQCRWEELTGLRLFAKEYLISIGVDVSKLKRLAVVMPERKPCGFAGLGMLGCPVGDLCSVWLQGYDRIDNTIIFHELMHNTGLLHSNRYSKTHENLEYGDPSDPMGHGRPMDYINQYLCLNAPQAYKAGWMSPMRQLDFGSINNYVLLQIPVFGSVRNSFIRITNGSVVRGIQPAIYISYRQRGSEYDTGLENILNSRVYIHEFNGTTVQPRPDPWGVAPGLLAIMDVSGNIGQLLFGSDKFENRLSISSVYNYGNWIISMGSKTAEMAEVYVCRYMGPEDNFDACLDSYDNDCDGRVDLDSIVCQEIMGLTPMPPPLAPSRPPMPPSPSPPSPPVPPSPRPPKVPARPKVIKKRKSPPPPPKRSPRPSPRLSPRPSPRLRNVTVVG